MSEELVNEMPSGFGHLFAQQDDTYTVREIPEILARNLDATVLDYGWELYSLHNLPLLSEQDSEPIAAQRLNSPAFSDFG
ncbi:hypothetical protein LQF76_03035 [Gloeomargaritales cyanobacterium VI4D9]|nr:hypothetical protein LQF76_03035 [Gloeomargaritales cyanobacterium VI4D9]